jgi:hypothetical protein
MGIIRPSHFMWAVAGFTMSEAYRAGEPSLWWIGALFAAVGVWASWGEAA